MSDIRLIQNFRGCRGLVIAGPATATGALVSTLARLGVEPAVMEIAAAPLAADLDPDRDIVFLDGDIDEPQAPAPGGIAAPPVPVIGLLGVAAPTRLKSLLRRGATAILHKPVQGAAVFSALFVGVNEFRRRRHFEVLLDRQERRLRARRVVIKAVVGLMHERGIDEDEAYRWLRRESMASRVSLEDICDRLVAQAAPRDPPNDTTSVKGRG